MPLSRAFFLATVVSVVGCTETTFEPTRQPGALRQTQYDARQYEVRDLGIFAGQPTQAMDIDKHGSVYGRYGTGSAMRSYRWTERSGFDDLGGIGGTPFMFLSVNDHGLLNGSIFTATGQRAAAWLPHRGFVLLDPEFPGNTLGNNDRGEVAGTRFEPAGVSRAFVWSEKEGLLLVPVSVDGGVVTRSTAADVDDVGIVAGTVTFTSAGVSRTRAFVWDETNGTTLLPTVGPANFGVTYISEEGLVLGASEMRGPRPGDIRRTPVASNPGTIPVHAWKWSAAGGLVDLGTLGGNHSVAWNADRAGNVYGWASDAGGVQRAVKWPAAGGVIDLGGLGGNTLTGGLNKHGVVAGWSTPTGGVTHAVIFTPRKK
ncbi:MAG TPA: hypothetical protein VMY38_00860 [Gemmatimonadaceae bacterium]|nr:hypothetical protein [Gemmatimonadaceae bacterium]